MRSNKKASLIPSLDLQDACVLKYLFKKITFGNNYLGYFQWLGKFYLCPLGYTFLHHKNCALYQNFLSYAPLRLTLIQVKKRLIW
ncbi:MAG: hypothetical protein Q8O30_11650 [Candidatus Omnitrophota bacterium]|nr:hypothetical protein [Candidatus Omnitrophota bacterium]